MDARTLQLMEVFDESLNRYDKQFIGSKRTDRQLDTYQTALDFLKAPDFRFSSPTREFACACHEMLGAWNMNSRGAELVDVDTLASSLSRHMPALEAFCQNTLAGTDEYEMRACARDLWSVLSRLEVGTQRTKMVTNTKLGHVLLPELVPPFDNKYTKAFFVLPDSAWESEVDAFSEILIRFARLAKSCNSAIAGLPRTGWHTTPPKVIDNAIQGFMSRGGP